MARKEQDGRRESKSRAAMRQSARAPASAPAEAPKTAPVQRGKAKERAGCVVASCACAHEYQDSRYGSHMRVFNLGRSKANCTVCGNARAL